MNAIEKAQQASKARSQVKDDATPAAANTTEVKEADKSPSPKRGSVFGMLRSSIFGGKKKDQEAEPDATGSAESAAEAVPAPVIVTAKNYDPDLPHQPVNNHAINMLKAFSGSDENVSKDIVEEMVKHARSASESWETKTPDDQMLRPGQVPFTEYEVEALNNPKEQEEKESKDTVRNAVIEQMNAKLSSDAKNLAEDEEKKRNAETKVWASSVAAQLPSRRPSLSGTSVLGGSRRPSLQQLPSSAGRRPSSLSLFRRGKPTDTPELDASIDNALAVEDDRLERCRNWIKWFQDSVPDVSAEHSMIYVDILWDNHLTTPARLKKSIAKNPDLLTELKFHDDDASDVLDALEKMTLTTSEMQSPMKEVITNSPFAASTLTRSTPTPASAVAVAFIAVESPKSISSTSEKVRRSSSANSADGTTERDSTRKPGLGGEEDEETQEAKKVAAEYASAIAETQEQLRLHEEAEKEEEARKEAELLARRAAQATADEISAKYIPEDARDIVSVISIDIADKFQWGPEVNGLVVSLQISGIDLWINGRILSTSNLNLRCHRVCFRDAVEFDLNLAECTALKLELCEATVGHAIHATSNPEKCLRSMFYPDLGSIPIPYGSTGVSPDVLDKRIQKLAKWAALTQTRIDKLDKEIADELAAVRRAEEEAAREKKEAEEKRKAEAVIALNKLRAESEAKKAAELEAKRVEDARLAAEMKARREADAAARLAQSERDAKAREEEDRRRQESDKREEETRKQRAYEGERARIYGDAVGVPKREETPEQPKTWAEKQAEKKALENHAPAPTPAPTPAPAPVPVPGLQSEMTPAEILAANRLLRQSVGGKSPGATSPAPPPPGPPRRVSVAADPNAPPPPTTPKAV